MASGRNFTENSARDTSLAVQEAQAWIEAVTQQKFKQSFRESLEDGVILCELIQTIRPGCVRKINRRSNPIAHLDNIRQFLGACKELGLKDAQLFEVTDLQPPSTLARKESSNNVLRRSDAVRHIRNVCVTLFWLGNVVSTLKDYTGPQLDLKAFKEILAGGEDERAEPPLHSGSKTEEALPHSGTRMEAFSEDNEETTSSPPPEPLSTNFGLTFEQEQTADQLLADIQNAVDEMLNTYKPSAAPDLPPERSPTPELDSLPFIESPVEDGPLKTVTINMRSRGGGFGCQVVGGADTQTSAKVELVVPGSAAEGAGLMAGDCIASIDGRNVDNLTHMEIVNLIRKGGAAGGVILSVLRGVQLEVPHEQDIGIPTDFVETRDIAHSAERSLDSLEWAETVNLGMGLDENKQASIGKSDEDERHHKNVNSIPSQPSQGLTEEQVQPAQFIQPAVARIESQNQFQKLGAQPQSLNQQSVSSKTIHVVHTSWAGSATQPQQVSVLPPAEPTFPQNGVQDGRKSVEKVATFSVAEEPKEDRTRTYKYAMPKVASFDFHENPPPQTLPKVASLDLQEKVPPQTMPKVASFDLQGKAPPQTTSSQLSQVARTTAPPQTPENLQTVSSQLSASSQGVAPPQTSPLQLSVLNPMVAPPQTSVFLQSNQTITLPQTSVSLQTITLPQTTVPLQSSQTITLPQTSSAAETVAPPVTPDVEHHGTVKIQKVHHTRWTPKSQPDTQRESQSEATTPAKTPTQNDQRKLSLTNDSTPVGRMGGSLPRHDLQHQATSYYPQPSAPTGRVVQRSMSDRRQNVVHQLPPLPLQTQTTAPQQQHPTQVALVSHGLYATVTYKQDACSRCRRSLQPPGFVMTIASHKLQFHMGCFTCYVCRTPLTYDSRGESQVLILRGEVHCKLCSSNNKGTKTTEC